MEAFSLEVRRNGRGDVVVQGLVGRALTQGDHPQLGVERLLGLDNGAAFDADDAGHLDAGVVDVDGHGVVNQGRHLATTTNERLINASQYQK